MTTRTKAIFGLSAVFLIGLICGGAIVGLVVRDRVRDAQRMKEKEGFSEAFLDRLEVTEAQRDSLRGSLEQAYEEIRALRNAAQEEYQEVLDTLRGRVYPRLTAEQRTRYDQIEERVLPPELRPHRQKEPPSISNRVEPQPTQPEPIAPATVPAHHDTAKPAIKLPVTSTDQKKTSGDKEKNEGQTAPKQRTTPEQLVEKIMGVYGSHYSDLTDDQQQRIRFNVVRMLERLKEITQEVGDDRPAWKRMAKLAVGAMHKRILQNILTDTQRESYIGIPREINQIVRAYIKERTGEGGEDLN